MDTGDIPSQTAANKMIAAYQEIQKFGE